MHLLAISNTCTLHLQQTEQGKGAGRLQVQAGSVMRMITMMQGAGRLQVQAGCHETTKEWASTHAQCHEMHGQGTGTVQRGSMHRIRAHRGH
eukprot:scaffold169952_cov20-Tisochrysis_lutea.AAC.1